MDKRNISCLFRLYAQNLGLSTSRVSFLVVGYGTFYKRLESGCSCTLKTYNRVLQWLSDHWPVDLAWPADILRPPPAEDSPYAAALAAQAEAQNLNESTNDSGNPLALNDAGELASPKALAASLLPSYAGEAQMQSMIDSYYQLTRQYADGRCRADKSPRKHSQAARLLAALIRAGDVRFQARIDQAAEFRAISERMGLAS